MTFTSATFFIFLPVVVLIYNLISQRARVCYLLLISYIFYALMQPVYLALLIAVTAITYGSTRWMESVENERRKKKIMISGIILILLPLFFYKYFDFFNQSITAALTTLGVSVSLPTVQYMLPVGISFYTFMSIGYLVDVYNEETEVEKDAFNVGLFLSFFPYILSGPIERAGNIFPQLHNLKKSTPALLTSGAKLMLWGYFMKLCVADRMGIYIDHVFSNFSQYNGTSLTIASLMYPFQVYTDLGGYSLIAIGVAQCLGISIIPNFNRPFFATSMSELWRRWHMSLINWLTDYIYTPLSFALRSWKIWGIVTALMLTFFISGIWHGAAMTFIVWGLVQGVYLSIEAMLQKKRTKFEKRRNLDKNPFYIFLCCLGVFLLFAFSQIFGKCQTIADASIVIGKIFTDHGVPYLDYHTLLYSFVFLFIVMIKDFRDEYFPDRFKIFESSNVVVRIVSYYLIIITILEFGANGQSFIYFQF